MTLDPTRQMIEICPVDAIDVETGVAALVHGEAVAVFRTYAGDVFALSNYDPFSHASVLSRGIVGTRTVDGESVDFVASPIYKEAFDLRTGICLDKPEVSIAAYEVVVREGVVYVGSVKAVVEE
ncbi:nitrite reductase small subunit [Nocardioides baekrokdamisoli]|uniref:Nitrite reductase small subunit n=1 Tax=Nocardioides baekrokdamisoli TaxID=1804624 RepID=A0A3G9IFW2_9ACTN|nr:nitrite reductase small subunit NirD [Nocardioides baekrokdamisoli]BBH17162.1 nitrite reductase small subunit [Nocardioides baekrokdamisoli]